MCVRTHLSVCHLSINCPPVFLCLTIYIYVKLNVSLYCCLQLYHGGHPVCMASLHASATRVQTLLTCVPWCMGSLRTVTVSSQGAASPTGLCSCDTSAAASRSDSAHAPSYSGGAFSPPPSTRLFLAHVCAQMLSRVSCTCAPLVAQSCPTLDTSHDCSPPGSSDHDIFQARTLEWVTVSSSRGSS